MTYHTKPVKVQVPLSPYLYEDLQTQAADLGFDSVPAYVRFWARSATQGRAFMHVPPDLSLPEMQAMRFLELFLASRHVKPKTLKGALQLLDREIHRALSKGALQGLGLQ